MNKIVIKYLICIILISIALILIPINKVDASLSDVLNNR